MGLQSFLDADTTCMHTVHLKVASIISLFFKIFFSKSKALCGISETAASHEDGTRCSRDPSPSNPVAIPVPIFWKTWLMQRLGGQLPRWPKGAPAVMWRPPLTWVGLLTGSQATHYAEVLTQDSQEQVTKDGLLLGHSLALRSSHQAKRASGSQKTGSGAQSQGCLWVSLAGGAHLYQDFKETMALIDNVMA